MTITEDYDSSKGSLIMRKAHDLMKQSGRDTTEHIGVEHKVSLHVHFMMLVP